MNLESERNTTYRSYSSLTRELATTHGNSLLECQNKLLTRGFARKGDAIRQAINNLEGSKLDFVVFLDADGSYSFDGVKKVLFALEAGADVVSDHVSSVKKATQVG